MPMVRITIGQSSNRKLENNSVAILVIAHQNNTNIELTVLTII
ncbi:MAG: hypothetical protein ACI9JN_001653 [Bacteroidia bacterium]|jgi:hypothetical protein